MIRKVSDRRIRQEKQRQEEVRQNLELQKKLYRATRPKPKTKLSNAIANAIKGGG